MTRNEQEMALWADEYSASRLITRENRAAEADAAVAEFRKRYPATPTAPESVWYDEPPFAKDGESRPCWVGGEDRPGMVYWGSSQWLVVRVGGLCPEQLNNRRVYPITKPPETTK